MLQEKERQALIDIRDTPEESDFEEGLSVGPREDETEGKKRDQ